MIDLGKLDKRVGIYAPTESTSSTTGEVTESFALSTTAWMEMVSDPGNEQVINLKESVRYRVRWRVRSGHTINERYRLYYDSKYYDILSIEEESRYFDIINTVRHE